MNLDVVRLREVVTKLVPMLTGKGLRVTSIGSQAYVKADPATRKPTQINIPSISDNASPEFCRAIQGFIDHEVGHVLITDWNYYGGGPTLKELQDPKVQRFQMTHNIVEDTMIEREIVKIFPGSRSNIHDLRELFISEITGEALKKARDDKERFVYLTVPMMRALAGHEEFQEFMDAGGHWANPYVAEVVKKLKPATKKALRTVTTTKETLAIARELHAILYPEPKPQPPAPQQPPSDPADEQDGQSQDKPDQKAGEGDGDGERDHSESEPGDEKDDTNADDDKADADAEPGQEGDAEPGKAGDDADEGAGTDEDEPADDDDAEDHAASEAGDADDAAADEADDAAAGGNGSENDDPESDASDREDDEDDATGTGAAAEDDADDEDGEDAAEQTPGDGAGGADGGVDEDIRDTNEDDEEGNGGGIGGAEAESSLFEENDLDLEGQDMSSAMGEFITREAVERLDRSDYTVFTREFDKIEILVTPKLDSKWVPEIEDRTRSMVGRMQKDIERLMAANRHNFRVGGYRSGRLHAPALHRIMLQDDRLFSRKHESVTKDTAVTLLIDNSGSMSVNGGRGYRSSMHETKIYVAMVAAFALSQTLERVSIPHEMIGFTTGGYGANVTLNEAMQKEYATTGGVRNWSRHIPLVMPVFKEFSERVSPQVKQRIAYMACARPDMNSNIDGEAIEIAAVRLLKRREKRKVMIVLSDGQPAGAMNCDRHLKMVVEDVQKAGVDMIGIGIMDSSVKSFYPKAVVLNDLESLPTQVMSELKEILL